MAKVEARVSGTQTYRAVEGSDHALHVKLVGTDGVPYSASGGGGSGGDASAANQVITNAEIGIVTETVPATDTASSGLNGRLQRIAQRLTSLIALLPASLGIKTAAASLSIAPASDASFATTAAQLPASLGTKTAAASLAVALASDDAMPVAVGAKADAAAADDTGTYSLIALVKRGLQSLTSLYNMTQNPSVITGTISAATATPTTVAGLTASSYIQIVGGVVDSVIARIATIAGTATLAFYATDDDVNLYPISGLPVGGTIGSGALVASSTAVGAWSLKGASVRKVYLVATAIAGGNVTASLAATINMSRVTAMLRGSLGGAITAALGSPTSEAVTVQGTAYRAIPTVTRPANQTPYTAGDVVGGAIEFQSIGPSGGHTLVTSADLAVYIAAVPSGMTSFRLHVYDATPPSALADNAVWDLPSGDRANYLGYIDMGTPVDVGSTLYVQADGVNKQFKLAASQTSLWGYMVTNGGFTPAANSEVYMPRLRALGV